MDDVESQLLELEVIDELFESFMTILSSQMLYRSHRQYGGRRVTKS